MCPASQVSSAYNQFKWCQLRSAVLSEELTGLGEWVGVFVVFLKELQDGSGDAEGVVSLSGFDSRPAGKDTDLKQTLEKKTLSLIKSKNPIFV